MPITRKSLYPRILSRIVAHWKEVDAALPRSSPFLLHLDPRKTISLRELVDLVLSIRAQLAVVQQRVENATEARLVVDSAKRAILFRAQAIARNIHWKANGSSRNQITYPRIHDDCETFISCLEEMAGAWSFIDQSPNGPMTLAGRYRHSDFINELKHLVEAIAILRKTTASEKIAREEYETLFELIPSLLESYHRGVMSALPNHSLLLRNLPPVSIPDDPVAPPTACSGTWSVVENSAVITWQPSTEEKPHQHEIRYSPGDKYDSEVESTLAVIPTGQPLVWKGTGSSDPGSFLSIFRVYVVLKSGAESHGGDIVIIRSQGDD